MQSGMKFVLGGTVLLLLAVGVQVLYLHHRNVTEAAAPATNPAYDQETISDDDAVTLNLHKERPDSLKDERTLIGKTLWVSAGRPDELLPLCGASCGLCPLGGDAGGRGAAGGEGCF